MTLYASSKIVHAALRRAFSPWFTANGWKRRPGYSCAFIRPSGSGCWCLWFQVSSWGGQLSGSSFTLNLVHQASAESELCGGPGARVLCTLSPAEIELGFSIAQQLATRIPDPPASDPVHEWAKLPGYQGEMWRKRLADLREVNPDAWKPDVDVWLPYYAEADLALWVDFLLPRLEHLLRQSREQEAGAQ